MMFPWGAQLHALSYWFWRRSDKAQARDLYTTLRRQFYRHGLAADGAFKALFGDITNQVADHFQLPADHPQRDVIKRLVLDIVELEDLFLLPTVNWSERRSISQYWTLRDELNRQLRHMQDLPGTTDLLGQTIIGVLTPLYQACPALLQPATTTDAIVVKRRWCVACRSLASLSRP